MSGGYDEGTFFSLGSAPVTLYFTSDDIIPSMGFRLHYYIGVGSPGTCSIYELCF